MSKLIVEMEMPKNCHECEAKCVSALYGRICGMTRKNIMPFLDKPNRPDWCPIKGVLPEQHGDLIDRDVMHKDIQLWKSTATDTITMCFLYHIEKILMCIRPIIEAERKDDGTTAD